MKKVILISMIAAFLSLPTIAHDNCDRQKMVACVWQVAWENPVYQTFPDKCPIGWRKAD